jgi:coatomer protein complex subunit alpha (xenin)
MTATFCRRILELCVSSNNANIAKMVNVKQIKGVLAACEKSNVDENPFDFPENMNFSLCCKSFTPINKGKNLVRCPYDGSAYHQQYDEGLCLTCGLAKIGAEATGIKIFNE